MELVGAQDGEELIKMLEQRVYACLSQPQKQTTPQNSSGATVTNFVMENTRNVGE